jgi:hypothetical protein
MTGPMASPTINPPVRRGEARGIVAPLTLSVTTQGASEFISDVGGEIGASVMSPHNRVRPVESCESLARGIPPGAPS